jgi:hypothetical protein
MVIGHDMISADAAHYPRRPRACRKRSRLRVVSQFRLQEAIWRLDGLSLSRLRSHIVPSGKHPTSEAAMNDTDKLVAAIFAAGICSHPGNKPEDYYAYYETFLKMAKDREEAAEIDANKASVEIFTKLGS